MIDGQDRVTVSKERRQILKLKQGRSTAIIERPGPVQLSVVRAGLQGPPGYTVDATDEVLARVASAEQNALAAKELAQSNYGAVDLMLDELTTAFNNQTVIIDRITQ